MAFQNQKIVVAGGTSGIGLATAKRFVSEGAIVTVTGRNQERLKAVEREGKVAGGSESVGQGSITATSVDSRDRAALDKFFSGHGLLDHLVIATGGAKGLGEFSGLSLGILEEGFAEKFWPQLETLQAALSFINAGGSVTLITGIASVSKRPGQSGLAAINGALELMVPVLAQELKPIRINAVSPGLVDTPWWDFLPAGSKPAAFAQFSAGIPAGRAAQPEEIADVIALLAGNAYMTGKVVGCDGGLS